MNLLVMDAGGLTPDWLARWRTFLSLLSIYLPRQAFGIPPRRLARIVEHIRKNLDTPLAVGTLSRLARDEPVAFLKAVQTQHRLGTAPVRVARAQSIVRRSSSVKMT